MSFISDHVSKNEINLLSYECQAATSLNIQYSSAVKLPDGFPWTFFKFWWLRAEISISSFLFCIGFFLTINKMNIQFLDKSGLRMFCYEQGTWY